MGTLQDVGGKHITNVVRAVRQKTLDDAAPGVGIVDAIALDDQPPCLEERILVVGGCCAIDLDGLDEEGPRIGSALEK